MSNIKNLPPAGRNLFEKRFLHLQKLLFHNLLRLFNNINRKFLTPNQKFLAPPFFKKVGIFSFLFLLWCSFFTFPKQVIILKADDFVASERFQRFIDYIEKKNLKASLGVTAKSLKDDKLCDWLKVLASKENFEIWNHGLIHELQKNGNNEFKGLPYKEQWARIRESQEIFQIRTGIICDTWGAPYNKIDANTARALATTEEIKIWFYGIPRSGKKILKETIETERPAGYPNETGFIEQYERKKLEKSPYVVLQLHPNHWTDTDWESFEKIIDFLLQKDVVFMNPTEYANPPATQPDIPRIEKPVRDK
ncbi:MAG: DUF2334 domain-containing protein [Candidatus Omnitrophota bacterium]